MYLRCICLYGNTKPNIRISIVFIIINAHYFDAAKCYTFSLKSGLVYIISNQIISIKFRHIIKIIINSQSYILCVNKFCIAKVNSTIIWLIIWNTNMYLPRFTCLTNNKASTCGIFIKCKYRLTQIHPCRFSIST